jgi:HEPN domain-containing protein
VVCFHAQQCAEKYLKALVLEHQLPLRRIHDLEVLLDLVLPLSPAWAAFRNQILLLNDYSVDIRYPGETATKDEARAAVRAMRVVRKQTRQDLGL